MLPKLILTCTHESNVPVSSALTLSRFMVYLFALALVGTYGGTAITSRRHPLIAALFVLIVIGLDTRTTGAQEPLFAPLEKRLIADGLDQRLVETIYRNPEAKLEPGIMAGNLKRREKSLNYRQFLTDAVVARSHAYLELHRPELQAAFHRFGIQPSIIVAVLTIETGLGTYTGRFLTINVLSTMAVADDPQVQEKIVSSLQAKGNAVDPDKNVRAWLRQRADRGYKELKAFLNYLGHNGLDPFSIKGSAEGAIGIPQFLPSNIGVYACDSNGDGVVDLFNHGDAIASVASFLKSHRWNQARTASEKKKVLLRYNRSTYYVDTIYRLADRLERMESKRPKGA